MVAINDLQIPIYMHFLLNFNKELCICLINVDRNLHSLVYISIKYPSFYFIIILKQRIHLDFT